MSLVLLTGATSLLIEGSFISQPLQFLLFLLGLFLTGGSANALNQYFERDIDSRMTRTRKRRPLPTGKISSPAALTFSIAIGVGGVVLLWAFFNLLTAMLALGTILFYGFFYTLWLKPRTPQNIVIGGVAGAMAPVGAWAAATGEIAMVPLILFSIVFIWTPPHFWSLAICFSDDYKKAGLPMMPLVEGREATLRRSLYYCLALIPLSLTYMFFGGGSLYLVVALGLGIAFVWKAVSALKHGNHREVWKMFSFSIVYLFGLCLAMIADHFATEVW